MNPAHLHLVLNHFPVVGTVTAVALLTLALVMKRSVLARAGLWALIVSGLMAIPVYLAGEGAEDVVEEVGVAHSVIEAHEEAALVVLVALLVLAALSAGVLWLHRHRAEIPRKLTIGVWVLSLVAGFLVVRLANLGGEIRHTEIRGELFGSAATAGADGGEAEMEHEDEGEDDDGRDGGGDGYQEAREMEGGG
jgi:uncharacterized membrane protein